MDYAVQPLIFFPRNKPDDSRFVDGANLCLAMAREWFARELGGRTFNLVDPVAFRSQWAEGELMARYRSDGEIDHSELWVGSMREAIHGGAITGAAERIYFFIFTGRGDERGLAWRRDYFGCAAYIAGHAAEVMAGIRLSNKRNGDRWLRGRTTAAGLMAHELGHCFSYFGTKQLENLDGSWQNVMGPGYLDFPGCVLGDDQKDSLLASPFIQEGRTLRSSWPRRAVEVP